MSKTCHACHAEVPESHQGKCPTCGKEEGYEIVRNITEVIKTNDSVNTTLTNLGINPELLSSTIRNLVAHQKDLQKNLKPLQKIFTDENMEMLARQFESIAQSTLALQTRLSDIKIPTITSASQAPEEAEVSNEAVDEVVEELEEIKEEIPEKENETQQIQNSLRDIQDQLNSQHTENTAEHQQTRDELLTEISSQNQEIKDLKNEIEKAWKKPKNWIIGVAIGAAITLLVTLL